MRSSIQAPRRSSGVLQGVLSKAQGLNSGARLGAPMRSDRVKSLGKFQLVFADAKGKAFSFPGLRPAGMKAGAYFPLEEAPAVRLPDASELFFLPDRLPVGFDSVTGESTVLESDPYSTNAEPCFAVAAFIPPGYTLTHNAAYAEKPKLLGMEQTIVRVGEEFPYLRNGYFNPRPEYVKKD